MALPNPSMSFSPFAILTAEEMNNLVENDQALAAGTGLNTGSIATAKLADHAVTAIKIDFNTFSAFRAYMSTGQAITGTATLVNFDTKSYDNTTSFNTTTHKWTCPATGIYEFVFSASSSNGTSARLIPQIRVNSSTVYSGTQQQDSFASGICMVQLSLTAGDTVDTLISYNPAQSGNLSSGAGAAQFYGHRVA